MFRRPVKCAVFVDFDNIAQIVGASFGEDAQAWLHWLEDAQHEPGGRRRRIVRRLVYWNEHNERKWRPFFEAYGFEAFNCPSQVKHKKSDADMRIALDAQRLAYEDKEVEEFVILSTDTDFVPLLNCLAALDRRTVAAANPRNSSLKVYQKYADLVIPVTALREACSYRRPDGLWRRILKRLGLARDAPPPKPVAQPPRALGAQRRGGAHGGERKRLGLWRSRSAEGEEARPKGPPELERAADIVLDIAMDAPGLPIARRTLERRLNEEMPAFRTRGVRPYLGCGGYRELLQAIVKRRDNLRLHLYANGGAAISYRD
ncbi:MAG: NYN domain-containing protein [Pseudomonadota bacterium]